MTQQGLLPDRRRTTVFFVDDHPGVRQALAAKIDAEPDLHVIGDGEGVADGLAGIVSTRPDVAVLDVRLLDGNGVSLCRAVRRAVPKTACLILTSRSEDEALLETIVSGASGYVLKQIRNDELVEGIRRAARGESLLDPHVVTRAVSLFAETGEERDVLVQLAAGASDTEVARALGIDVKRVSRIVDGFVERLAVDGLRVVR
jgi:DNA-binding NarL/FixJ family response regulator